MEKNKGSKKYPYVIALAALVILVLGFAAVQSLRMRAAISGMQPANTQQVIEGIYAVKTNHVNFYVIKSGDRYIVVDAGVNAAQARQELDSLNIINPDDVGAVLLTHTDGDHTAALSLFQNATVYIADEEVQMVDGRVSRNLLSKKKLNFSYQTLGDGQTVELLGTNVQCILTPGHTKGSMCYLIDDNTCLSEMPSA